MAPSYSISGISPLGTIGLGSVGFGSLYDSYMPSNYGMGFGMGYGMMSPYSGYGMQAMVDYQRYYQQAQAEMERMQLAHSQSMQEATVQAGAAAHRASDRALVEKIINNADVQYGIDNLYQAVRSGNQKSIQKQFAEVRNFILNTYADEFQKLGNETNPLTSANQIIKDIYAEKFSNGTGRVDLEADIIKYGPDASKSGYLKGLNGDDLGYVDDTLNFCFGRVQTNYGKNQYEQEEGYYIGRAASYGSSAIKGAGVGVGLLVAGKGAKALMKGLFSNKAGAQATAQVVSTAGKSAAKGVSKLTRFGRAGVICAALGAIAGMCYNGYSRWKMDQYAAS